jgi:hypothetical protein
MAHHNKEIARFRLADFAIEDYGKVQGYGEGRITLDHGGAWGKEPIIVLIDGALRYVQQNVLPRFEPFFTAAT